MNEVLEIVTRIMLLVLIGAQLIMVAHMMYTSHKRFKQDTEFWKRQSELTQKLYENADQISADAKESATDEQKTTEKK